MSEQLSMDQRDIEEATAEQNRIEAETRRPGAIRRWLLYEQDGRLRAQGPALTPGEVVQVVEVGAPDRDAVGPNSGSRTSREAALHNYPRSGTQRWKVLEAVLDSAPRGATRFEIEQQIGLGGDTVRPRVWELIKGGFLAETERTRPTRFGEQAVVLEATRKARLARLAR